jgi:hypothetical protein
LLAGAPKRPKRRLLTPEERVERQREYSKRYYQEHKEERREYNRNYWNSLPEAERKEKIANSVEWQRQHRKHYREYQAAKHREWYAKDPTKQQRLNKEWRERNPEKAKEIDRRRTEKARLKRQAEREAREKNKESFDPNYGDGMIDGME